MKKLILVLLVFASAFTLAACGGKKEKFFAVSESQLNTTAKLDWLDWVVVTKKGDKITAIEWDAYHLGGDVKGVLQNGKEVNGRTKRVMSVAGDYGDMPGETGANQKWHEVTNKIIDEVIKTQVTTEPTEIAGVSKEFSSKTTFYTLLNKALKGGAIVAGAQKFKDGFHYLKSASVAETRTWATAELGELVTVGEGEAAAEVQLYKTKKLSFDYYTFANIIVVNGNAVHANFDAAFTGPKFLMVDGKITKVPTSVVDGNVKSTNQILTEEVATEFLTKNQAGLHYAMKTPNGPGSLEYFEFAKKVNDFIKTNPAKLVVPESGKESELIAGVTITLDGFIEVYNKLFDIK